MQTAACGSVPVDQHTAPSTPTPFLVLSPIVFAPYLPTNALPMSDRSPDPANTTPSATVEVPHAFPQNVPPQSILLPPPPTSRSKPVTTTSTPYYPRSPGSPGTTSPSDKLRRVSTFGDYAPQLSERESIWSTHYLPNDPAAQDSDLDVPLRAIDDLAQVLQNAPANNPLSSSPIGAARQPVPFSIKPKHSSLTQRLTGSKVKDGLPALTEGLDHTTRLGDHIGRAQESRTNAKSDLISREPQSMASADVLTAVNPLSGGMYDTTNRYGEERMGRTLAATTVPDLGKDLPCAL